MKKFIHGVALGIAIGAGAMWAGSSSNEQVDIYTIPVVHAEQRSPIVTSIGASGFENLMEQGKAAPCHCVHTRTGLSEWCEHENLYCDEDAAAKCQDRHKNYRCESGITARLKPR